MKTATYIKYMALHGKIVNVDMENANSILGALSRIEKSVTDSRLKCLMDYLLSQKIYKKGARSIVWLLTPRLTAYIFPFSRSLQRYA